MNEEDSMTLLAARIFNVDPKFVTVEMRRQAKLAAFPMHYSNKDAFRGLL